MTAPRWTPGAVTGVGSLPGRDPDDAARLVVGELPDLPHLAELPDRGPGADMIGRSAALLVDLPVEIAVRSWRITAHPGHELRRALDFWAWDLDALESACDGWTGPLKIQLAGPWTLAASVELANGHRIVRDHGAVRDLIASLTEGVRLHVADVQRRVPGATVLLQLDEPSLPAVIGGRVPTPSGYGTVRAVEATVAEQGLRDVLAVVPDGCRVVHCCAPDVPIALLRAAGADALSLDASLITPAHYDALGEAVDAGLALWPGVVPSTDATIDDTRAATTVTRIWSELGFAPAGLAGVVATPTCGLAGASPAYARRALRVLRDVGKRLVDAAV
ncbi:MAG: methionine synthase [Jatrophihabitans sp.]|uniref:methionine synthase n=1 Tax=Jatrophihabitans sp. TaxID=1932789 RepID=UPI003F821CCC